MGENTKIDMAFDLAFEAGRWLGQVDLEEHFDRRLGMAAIEVAYSKNHSMPMKDASFDKTIEITLRSDKWRDGVRKSSREYLEKAKQFLEVENG